jgi:hypothetical protein
MTEGPDLFRTFCFFFDENQHIASLGLELRFQHRRFVSSQ